MWNDFRTDDDGGMTAEVSWSSPAVAATRSTPTSPGPMAPARSGRRVLTHHPPGRDEFYREFARRFAEHGYIAIVPEPVLRATATARRTTSPPRCAPTAASPTTAVVADAEAAMHWLKSQPTSNGKVGIIGTCSGGRHAVLVASSVPGFDAVVDLWGGGVVAPPEQLTEKRPVAPIDLTPNLNAPLLGIFGNDDQAPPPGPGRPARGGAEGARQDLRVPPLRRRRPRLLLLRPPGLPAAAGDGRLGQGLRPSSSSTWLAPAMTGGRHDVHDDLDADRRSPAAARAPTGWFPVSQANVGYDHATHTQNEHALLLDFVNPGRARRAGRGRAGHRLGQGADRAAPGRDRGGRAERRRRVAFGVRGLSSSTPSRCHPERSEGSPESLVLEVFASLRDRG